MKELTLLDKAILYGCTSLDDAELAALISGIDPDVMIEIMALGYSLPEMFKSIPFENAYPEIDWFIRIDACAALKNRISRIKAAFSRGAA